MSILTNYHTHTTFCDGKENPEAYVQAALAKGLSALGFSAHAPAPKQEDWTMANAAVPAYLKSIRNLQKEYSGRIEVYCGLEVDYISGELGPSSPHIVELGLDYTLGAVHIMPYSSKSPTVDGPISEYMQIIDENFNGDHRAAAAHFYDLVGALTREHSFDILAHFDLIKVPNKGEQHYTEKEEWYRDSVLSALDAVAEAGVIMEINTGGLVREKTDTVYPSPWILQEARKRDIPIMINSDVHSPEMITALFSEAAEAAKAAGYSEKRILLEGSWQDVPI